MDFPVTIPVGSLRLPLHAPLELLAFFGGFRYYKHLRRRNGDPFSSERRIVLIVAAVFGAFAGSRLVGILERPNEWAHASNLLLYLFSNKTVLGGLLGGLAGVEWVKKRIGEKRASGDLYVYPILLGLCIGRLGCFSMGIHEETYGQPTGWFTGMNLGDGVQRHPVALYEIIFLLLLWCLLRAMEKTSLLAPGALFKLMMIGYLLFRFFLDYIKPCYPYPWINLSAIQMAAFAGLLYYSPYIFNPNKLLQTAYART